MRLRIRSANILADKNPLMSILFIIRTGIRSGEEVLTDESVADPVLRSSEPAVVDVVAEPVRQHSSKGWQIR